jgi:hypothetical protein
VDKPDSGHNLPQSSYFCIGVSGRNHLRRAEAGDRRQPSPALFLEMRRDAHLIHEAFEFLIGLILKAFTLLFRTLYKRLKRGQKR